MVNSQIIKEIVEQLKLDLNADKIPQPIPIIEVGNKCVANSLIASLSSATSATILAANPNNDVYILGASLSVVKNAVNTSTGTSILLTDEGGTSRSLIKIAGITTTAQDQITSIILNHPIKIKRNTAVTLSHGAADGVILGCASVYYYVDEIS